MISKNVMQASAYKLGANDYIIKPINRDIALSRIQNLLRARKRIKKHMLKM